MRLTKFAKKSFAVLMSVKAKLRFMRSKELKDLVKPNRELKDIHKGKRCFILGNGPSLNDEDLASLKNEYVFTVNKISKHPQFEQLKTNYHFWADPAFFNISEDNEGDKDLLKTFFSIKTDDNNPVCFLPHYARNFAKQFKVEEQLDVRYYCAILPFKDDENGDIDFSKATFGFDTVVQWAISMAIYMGFSEIYLLGCDMTYIIGTIQTYLNEENNSYAYDVSDAEKQFVRDRIINKHGIESQFMTCAKMLHLYGELKKYCDKRGIKLVNCSSKTIIDSLPRKSLRAVLNMKGESDENSSCCSNEIK